MTYHLFTYRCYYPEGGINDYRGSFPSTKAAFDWLIAKSEDESYDDGDRMQDMSVAQLVRELNGRLAKVAEFFNGKEGWEPYRMETWEVDDDFRRASPALGDPPSGHKWEIPDAHPFGPNWVKCEAVLQQVPVDEQEEAVRGAGIPTNQDTE